jgi:hypothetical protein
LRFVTPHRSAAKPKKTIQKEKKARNAQKARVKSAHLLLLSSEKGLLPYFYELFSCRAKG